MSLAAAAMIKKPLTWLNFGDANGSVDKLLHERGSKCVDGMFGCTVDASSSVSFYAGDGAKVDNMTSLPLLELYEAS